MKAAGVPIVPGTDETLVSVEAALSAARELGFPLMLKAVPAAAGRGNARCARCGRVIARSFPLLSSRRIALR